MRRCLWLLVILGSVQWLAAQDKSRKQFFLNLASLDFEAARRNAAGAGDSTMRFELLQLADVLFYEGQKDRMYFKLSDRPAAMPLQFIRALNAGYVSLFYDRDKGHAYKYFYQAYQIAKGLNDPLLIKASLLAFFKYHNFEIAQISESYKRQLDHFESLKDTDVDGAWLAIYSMIYYSKFPVSLGKVDDRYYEWAAVLDKFEKRLDPRSPVLAHVYYEKAIRFMIDKKPDSSEHYFRKVIAQAGNFPFLKDERFSSYIKLLILEGDKGNFKLAEAYLAKARSEIDMADTLRSHYYLNLYSALNLYSGQKRYDSAYLLLKKAYLQEFRLDFRRNTLEINRLNVELETQEKENANLRLRQSKTWLISSLAGVALLLVVSYFAYANQRSKNRMQAKAKEVQAIKLEKLLKDQELFGIDAMIEGQEKERQRIADDLHDNLGSVLAAVKLHFHHINNKRDVTEPGETELLEKMDDLLEEAYQKVRTMAHARNAGVNAQEGLLPAVHDFAAKVSIINKLHIEVEAHGMARRVENSLEITIFRIIQELITNVIKHANATVVTIHLTHHVDSINLMVEDNGTGFHMSMIKPKQGMGLHSIQRRIENLGGSVTIDSVTEKGTTVIIDIPLT